MPFDIFDCSTQAKARIKTSVDNVGTSDELHRNAKYPFDKLEIGKCFIVPIADVKVESSFRNLVIQTGKQKGKKFTVIKHNSDAVFEVARIE